MPAVCQNCAVITVHSYCLRPGYFSFPQTHLWKIYLTPTKNGSLERKKNWKVSFQVILGKMFVLIFKYQT